MDAQSKVVSSYDDGEFAEQVAKLPRPLVFTNGCFDLLHRGHIAYLEEARNLGTSLVVGVNSDESVKQQNKGSDRPINSLDDRMAVLASLACVDLVVSFNDETPIDLIEKVMPDHLVKGGDWKVNDIVGAKEVVANGGKVHSLAFKFDRSTTRLIEKIRGL